MNLNDGIAKTKIFSLDKEEAEIYFGNVSNSGRLSDNLKYKTEMCKNWIETGTCSYEMKCKYAHGYVEIKDRLILNNKYRSKPCFEFHRNLYCPYGVRCLFYHNEKRENYYQ